MKIIKLWFRLKYESERANRVACLNELEIYGAIFCSRVNYLIAHANQIRFAVVSAQAQMVSSSGDRTKI